MALESAGRDRSDKDISDWANITWGKIASPKADCPLKRNTKTEHWEKRLAQLDRKSVVLPDEVQSTSSRRKRSENDSPDETRQRVRHKADSLRPLGPLSARTNVPEASSNRLTPPQSSSPAKPPWEVVSDEVLIWFAQPAQKTNVPCSSMAAWKRQVPRELRLHSLDSLLLGSGNFSGVVVVDECDEHAEKWTRLIEEKIVSRPILIYGCRSGVVSISNP